MRIRWRRALLVVPFLAALLVVPASASPNKPTGADCKTPLIAQALYRSADKVENVSVGGRKAVRFYQEAVEGLLPPQDIGHGVAQSPFFDAGSQLYYYRTDSWVDWYPSDPCTGPDGYGFGISHACWRGPEPSGLPRSATDCDWNWRAALQYDHAKGSWDSVWGHRKYDNQIDNSCTHSGLPHLFSDGAPGKVRTWTAGRMAFMDNGHLTQTRKTTSYHITIANNNASAGSGTNVLLGMNFADLPSGAATIC